MKLSRILWDKGDSHFSSSCFYHHLEIVSQSIKPTVEQLSYILHDSSISRDPHLLTAASTYIELLQTSVLPWPCISKDESTPPSSLSPPAPASSTQLPSVPDIEGYVGSKKWFFLARQRTADADYRPSFGVLSVFLPSDGSGTTLFSPGCIGALHPLSHVARSSNLGTRAMAMVRSCGRPKGVTPTTFNGSIDIIFLTSCFLLSI